MKRQRECLHEVLSLKGDTGVEGMWVLLSRLSWNNLIPPTPVCSISCTDLGWSVFLTCRISEYVASKYIVNKTTLFWMWPYVLHFTLIASACRSSSNNMTPWSQRNVNMYFCAFILLGTRKGGLKLTPTASCYLSNSKDMLEHVL